jgi:hypothetical protein
MLLPRESKIALGVGAGRMLVWISLQTCSPASKTASHRVRRWPAASLDGMDGRRARGINMPHVVIGKSMVVLQISEKSTDSCSPGVDTA